MKEIYNAAKCNYSILLVAFLWDVTSRNTKACSYPFISISLRCSYVYYVRYMYVRMQEMCNAL